VPPVVGRNVPVEAGAPLDLVVVPPLVVPVRGALVVGAPVPGAVVDGFGAPNLLGGGSFS
jgi:hypothetical protein